MAEDSAAQLTTFSCPECYVYAPLPTATSYGHRAELWDVEKWLKAVRLRLVTVGDDATVQLEDPENGELYAECPLPSDGTSLTTAVEPVVDSSRYFVVRLVDRAAPRKHAFIGLGFRTRNDASDFTAALDDYRQYLRRKAAAQAMRAEYEAGPSGEEGTTSGSSAAGPSLDLSLKPGQKIMLKLSGSGKRGAGQGDMGSGPSSSDSANGSSSSSFAARFSATGGGLLPPPPAAGGGLLRPPPPPSSSVGSASGSSDAAAAAAAAAVRQLRVSGSNSDHASQQAAPIPAATAAGGDDWAKFDD